MLFISIVVSILSVNIVCSHHDAYEIVAMKPEKFVHPYSAYWDEGTDSLYFIDFLDPDHTLHRYDWHEDQYYSAVIEGNETTAFIVPLKKHKHQFAGGIGHSVKIFEWNGRTENAKIIRTAFSVEQAPKYEGNLWNMAKASPTNQFYCSTYRNEVCSFSSAANGSVYRYQKELGVQRLVKNIKVPGGIEWDVKRNIFYYIDSCNGAIWSYDWDPKTGNICNGRIAFKLFELQAHEIPSFIPIEMCIDDEGYLWVALYYGSSVLKVDPRTSKIVKRIRLQAEIVTSVTFGGPKFDVLYVLTGSKAFALGSGKVLSNFSRASGTLYAINGLGSRGYPGRKTYL